MRAPDHLNALRAVEAAARHLSFALAAEELHVTPTAVGQLVRRLEENLGVLLFHRSQAGAARLVLTEAGRAAIPDLQTGFAHLTAAVERLRAAKARHRLAVTVPMAFADRWLLPRLDGFQRLHPDCDISIDTSTTLVDFATEPVDVGIRYGAGAWPGLAAHRFACDEFFPVCSPSLPEGGYPLRTPDDLRHHQLIHDTSMQTASAFPTWRDWYARAGLSIGDSERGLRIDDSAAAYRMVMAGTGVALGRTTLVARDLAEGRLVRPFGPTLNCPLAYHVVCRPPDTDRPMIVAFRAWLAAEAECDDRERDFA